MKIKDKIYTLRGRQVMLDSDLAELYEVETKQLKRAVKRNEERFPYEFVFLLTREETKNLRCQFGTSSWGGRRYLPYAFTEEGVAMLSSLLRSKIAINVSINIMKAFVAMRHLLKQNSKFIDKFQQIDQKLVEHDKNFEKIFNAIENKDIKPDKGIFFEGQIFDAHKFISDLINKAKNNIILIDNYIDYSTLSLFSNTNLNVTVYTKNLTRKLKLDLEKYNSQYKPIKIKLFQNSHDRFLILDNKEVYHIGASLKDLGKKWFAFSKINTLNILERLENFRN